MAFLNDLCDRPDNEEPVMVLPVGHPSDTETGPAAARRKKPLCDILTVVR